MPTRSTYKRVSWNFFQLERDADGGLFQKFINHAEVGVVSSPKIRLLKMEGPGDTTAIYHDGSTVHEKVKDSVLLNY